MTEKLRALLVATVISVSGLAARFNSSKKSFFASALLFFINCCFNFVSFILIVFFFAILP